MELQRNKTLQYTVRKMVIRRFWYKEDLSMRGRTVMALILRSDVMTGSCLDRVCKVFPAHAVIGGRK